jgi:hypothetical protein
VNKLLSSAGILLDNFGAKYLKNKKHKMRLVGPAGLEPCNQTVMSGRLCGRKAD